ncbi:MAG: peptide-methionine (S)-S-oxide reductase MsrA [Myxococcota bacterium]
MNHTPQPPRMLHSLTTALLVFWLTSLWGFAQQPSCFAKNTSNVENTPASMPKKLTTQAIATFAGGCFWCMQPPFDKTPGVISTVVGYTGGPEKNPRYKQVAYGRTGHAEAIRVIYDPRKVSYTKLLQIFWRNIHPTQIRGQFADIGRQYRTAIFVHSPKQRRQALASKKALAKTGCFKKPIATQIQQAGPFYPAERYHQKYYKKNYAHYKRYRVGSGRAGYLQRKWTAQGCRK